MNSNAAAVAMWLAIAVGFASVATCVSIHPPNESPAAELECIKARGAYRVDGWAGNRYCHFDKEVK